MMPGRTAASIVVVACLLAAGSCRDYEVVPIALEVQDAKACSETSAPGQQKKCPEPPPPPPDDHLPIVASEALRAPLRLAHVSGGWLLATDAGHGMVFRVDPVTLQATEGFRARGRTLGVTAMGGAIYVGNADRGTVDVHRTNGGGFTASFGPGVVASPLDLASDSIAGLIFALDGTRREVRVFTPWGDMTGTISAPGTEDAQLLNPTAIALDPIRQWVIVSDYGSADGGDASLKIFTYDGTFVRALSGAGSCGMLGCSGGFSRPQGAAVGGDGMIYVPDAVLAQVLVIDPESGDVMHTIGDRDFLRLPTDVAFDELGDLFIASNRTGVVQAVRGVGGP